MQVVQEFARQVSRVGDVKLSLQYFWQAARLLAPTSVIVGSLEGGWHSAITAAGRARRRARRNFIVADDWLYRI